MTRLVKYSRSVVDHTTPLIETNWLQYIKLRIQFWKWRLHHTMGRPVLVLRHKPTPTGGEEKK